MSKKNKVALIVGHNHKAKGAFCKHPVSQYEYDFNSEVAKLVQHLSPEYSLNVRVFYREASLSYSNQIRKVYHEVDKWEPAFAVELHFNAAKDQSAQGTETLSSGSKASRLIAAEFQKEFVHLFNRKGRADRQVKTRGPNDRGGKSLYCTPYPIRPCPEGICNFKSFFLRLVTVT